MGVKLVSASTGSVEIVPPTTASNFTATLPAGTGTMVVNGVNSSIVSGTVQPSTAGTSIDFTSIPSWVKRITVMWDSLSTNGTSNLLIQLGDSGGVETSGYTGACGTRGGETAFTSGFILSQSNTATSSMNGLATIALLGSNLYCMNAINGLVVSSTVPAFAGGSKTLSATLDRIRITTVTGTDTFDAGSINILYE